MFPDYIHRAAGFYFRKETIPMNLQNMEYLIEISNCGSISAAAKHLFVTQPYLSKVLRETEKEYGLTIFTRGKNGIIPSPDTGAVLRSPRVRLHRRYQHHRKP